VVPCTDGEKHVRVLIICLHKAEQAMAATVVIDNLKEIFQNSHIDVLAYRHSLELLSNNAHIDSIISFEDKSSSFLSKLLFFATLFFAKYDLVLDISKDNDGAFASYFTFATQRIGKLHMHGLASKLKCYTHSVNEGAYRHMVENCLDRLRAIDLKILSKTVNFDISKTAYEKIDNILKTKGIGEFVHFHPVSSELAKCADEKLVAQCIDYIQEVKGLKVVATALNNPIEADKLFAILTHCKHPPLTMVGLLNLAELGALSARAKMFFGVDGLPLHIAASQNTPTVALFGPSGVYNWGAWDNDVYESTYTHRNGIQKMGKHTMIQEELNCIPCGKNGCDESQISDCLMNIPLEKVKTQIDEKL